MPTPLRASAVLAAARNRVFRDVRVYGVVTSTNDVAARLAAAGARPGLAVFADGQTHGRGRRGAPWVSARRGGLWMSALIEAPAPAGAPLLAGAAGVAAAEAIRDASGADARVKWPNDVWIAGAKVGGVLIETRGARPAIAIAGIGVNLVAPDGVPPDAGAAPPTGVTEAVGRDVSREVLAAALLDRLAEAVSLVSADPAALRRRYRALDAVLGRDVVAETPEGRVAGRVASVDLETGIEIVLPQGGRRTLRPEHTHLVMVRG